MYVLRFTHLLRSYSPSSVVVTAQRVCLMVSDMVVVIVTVYYTYGTLKASRKANIKATFSATLLRAGPKATRI